MKTYVIVDERPWLATPETEERRLDIDSAVGRWEDLTGEDSTEALEALNEAFDHSEPERLEWTDPETGRCVTLTEESR